MGIMLHGYHAAFVFTMVNPQKGILDAIELKGVVIIKHGSMMLMCSKSKKNVCV